MVLQFPLNGGKTEFSQTTFYLYWEVNVGLRFHMVWSQDKEGRKEKEAISASEENGVQQLI